MYLSCRAPRSGAGCDERCGDLGEQAAVGSDRAKALAIYDDMVIYTALDTPDGYLVALDARTAAVRWETKSSGQLTSAPSWWKAR